MLRANAQRLRMEAVSSVFALFNLGGGEILLVLTLILLFAPGLNAPKGMTRMNLPKLSVQHAITGLLLALLMATVLACLR